MKNRPPVPEPVRRHPVWVALAELYLDSEPQEADLRRIAAACAASGFSWAELKQINYDEVAPALWPNLHQVAGVWGAWDEPWLLARLTAHYTGTRHRMLGFERWWRWRVDAYTAGYLAKVEEYAEALRRG